MNENKGQDHFIKINPDDFSYKKENKNAVLISKNNFKKLSIEGDIKSFLNKKNTIDKLELNVSEVVFENHQKVDNQGKSPYAHKKLFIALKNSAIEGKNDLQLSIMQEQIYRANIHILKRSKSFRNFRKSLTLFISHYFGEARGSVYYIFGGTVIFVVISMVFILIRYLYFHFFI